MRLADALDDAVLGRACARVGVVVDVARLRRDVVGGRYRPAPAWRRARPKVDGSTRWLTIPRPLDRAVQAAVLEVATRRLDARFDRRVHGFRPGRSPTGAVADLCRQVGVRPSVEVVQVDIASMFDALDHRHLRQAARQAWEDPLWNTLIGLWMDAWSPGTRGVPQGAPLSPLLANLYLDLGFDRPWAVACRPANVVGWIRYADDITAVTDRPYRSDLVLGALDGVIRRCGLTLAPRKVRHASLREPDPSLRVLGVRVVVARGPDGVRLVPDSRPRVVPW